MREIKFRQPILKPDGSFDHFHYWGILEDGFIGRDCSGNKKGDDQQFTGLKDNTKWEQLVKAEQEEWLAQGKTKEEWNGKEIYEGDIIRYSYLAGYALCEVRFGKWDNGESYEAYEGGYGWYIKEWAHYKFKGKEQEDIKVSLCGLTGYPLEQHKHKVIGNICENPELKKEAK